MKLIITAEFYNEHTPKEALTSLITHLTESFVWRGPDHGVIELRGLTADVKVMEATELPNKACSK